VNLVLDFDMRMYYDKDTGRHGMTAVVLPGTTQKRGYKNMSDFREYDRYDATGLGELIRKKEITPLEVLEEAVSRIEKLNPMVNAVVLKMFDHALKLAEGPIPDGPFTGVPFLLKDLLAAYKGFPLTGGSRSCRNVIPDRHSELVGRFIDSGLIVMGKTNTPEFGLMNVTEPELFGPARNPWDTNRTPGGSSGGSAAAVAAGMVPMASAGDGGGSIRIPASCCGLFGLKPSRGRNPTGPLHGRVWQGAVVEHVISRSVRDSAAVLDAVSGPDHGAPCVAARQERPFIDEVTTEPGKLKIAYSVASPIHTDVHDECKDAVHDAAALLAGLGHEVVEASPDIDGLMLVKSYLMMYFGEMAADLTQLKKDKKSGFINHDIEIVTRTLALLGNTFTAGEFVSMMRQWDIAARAMGSFHEKYDLYLTPTIALPPVRIGELAPKTGEIFMMKICNALKLGGLLKSAGIVDIMAVNSFRFTPFTQLANCTGQPAMSVPLYWTGSGLPVGVQFIAPNGNEALLFRTAGQLERARPWFDKRPALSTV